MVSEVLVFYFDFSFPVAELLGAASSLLLLEDLQYSEKVASKISELSSDKVSALSAII